MARQIRQAGEDAIFAPTPPLRLRQGGQSTESDPLPTFSLEGELHDESMLPHLYSSLEIERMFPQIQAAPVQPNAEVWIPSAAARTTDRRKAVRRNIGTGGKRVENVSDIC